MNKFILCEGKTDAIFLSYYLELVSGWSHEFKKSDAQRNFISNVNEVKGESMYWYKKDDEYLLICAVGGRDNFKHFVKRRILPAIVDNSMFSRVAIVIDRDDKDELSIIESILTSSS